MQKKFLLIGIIVLLAVIAGGVVVYKNFSVKETKKDNTQSQANDYKVFSSNDLGVTFTYAPRDENNEYNVSVTQSGNKIYVYNNQFPKEEGQLIEVFMKDPNISLKDAIKDRFLKGYDSKNCFVEDATVGGFTDTKELSNYIAANISFPQTNNPDGPWWDNASKCPDHYTRTNSAAYFLMNKDVPDRFLFVTLGQAAVTSDGVTGLDWSHSLRIFKPSVISNWKTYTNTQYGFELKYPDYLAPKESPANGTYAILAIDFVNAQTGVTEDLFYIKVYSGEILKTMPAGEADGVVNFKNKDENLLVQISHDALFDKNTLDLIKSSFKFTK